MINTCPAPVQDYERITLAHGGGGLLSRRLIDEVFFQAFQNSYLMEVHDGATLPSHEGEIAVTTDAHVVSPLFFPGGDIGSLSVYGGLNDLAACGARAKYLCMSFILEEGFPIENLKRIVKSIASVAQQENVFIVTGDTKVVERGRCEGIYITTTAIGVTEKKLLPLSIKAGDLIVVSGDVGRHGTAIMTSRMGLESTIQSDCANIGPQVFSLIENKIDLHCVRDLTRGGLAAALDELAKKANLEFEISEAEVPVIQPVRSTCEVLGLDPLHVPNEGRFVAFVGPSDVERAVHLLRQFDLVPAVVGRVIKPDVEGKVWVKGIYGPKKLLMLPVGDQLPRIC